MSSFSDRDILESIRKGEFSIDPLVLEHIQPASIDLTLDKNISVFSGSEPVDAVVSEGDIKARSKDLVIPEEGYVLAPGMMISGYSSETITLSTFVNGMILNRNSLASIGIDAAITAFANPGYSGKKSIVIRNGGQAPVILKAGMRICQLVIFSLKSPSIRSYKNRHDTSILERYASSHCAELEREAGSSKAGAGLSEFFNSRLAEISKRK